MRLNDSADENKDRQDAFTEVKKTDQCLSQGGENLNKGEENPALCV